MDMKNTHRLIGLDAIRSLAIFSVIAGHFEIKKQFDYDAEKIKEYLRNNYLTTVNKREGVKCNTSFCIQLIPDMKGGLYAA